MSVVTKYTSGHHYLDCLFVLSNLKVSRMSTGHPGIFLGQADGV